MGNTSELPNNRPQLPPDRFLLALGRVVCAMSNLDSILAEIVANSFAGPDRWRISVLVSGESADWRLDKLKRLIDEGFQFSENSAVTEYLRRGTLS